MKELDNFDLRLLACLEEDARQTLSHMAKTLRSSQQVISYRLQSLEKREIIGGYYAILDIEKLGYTSYRTFIRLSNINEQKHKQITEYLKNHLNVLWIVDCGGKWDLLVNFMAKNIVQYSLMLREFKSTFPEQIQNYDVLTTVQVMYLGRDYFTKKQRDMRKNVGFGGKLTETMELDENNLRILQLLSENARMNAVEIAEKIKISPNTVILRMKAMKKNGVLQGFKPLIHLENTPYHAYKALIKFHNLIEKKEEKILKYIKTDVRISGAIKLVGLWDFEIEFEVKNKEEMLEITRNFREVFKDVIKEFEILPLFHEYRYNFFPGDLLNSISA